MSKNKRNDTSERMRISVHVHKELLLSGKYGQRVERDKTKYSRHTKHRSSTHDGGVFVCVSGLMLAAFPDSSKLGITNR